MSSVRIHTTPHDDAILRQPTAEVDLALLNTNSFQKFLDQLTEAMFVYDGIGIAANQVGTSKKACVINTKEGPLVLINPRITRSSIRKEIGEEGCLSVPGVFGDVKRHRSITCKAIARTGEPLTLSVKGLFARVIQHEVDHLNGILFIDKAIRKWQEPVKKNQE